MSTTVDISAYGAQIPNPGVWRSPVLLGACVEVVVEVENNQISLPKAKTDIVEHVRVYVFLLRSNFILVDLTIAKFICVVITVQVGGGTTCKFDRIVPLFLA